MKTTASLNGITIPIRDWNKRPLTEKVFLDFVLANGIFYGEPHNSVTGVYFRSDSADPGMISVARTLTSPDKLFVQFHELGHYLTQDRSKPKLRLSYGGDEGEPIADAFAACALIPRRWLETKTVSQLVDLYSPRIVQRRIDAMDSFNV